MTKECKRCLLNEDIPGVQIQTNGECSVCHNHDETWGDWDNRKNHQLENLNRIFADCKKKKRPYDVLIPFSGGKDSSYVLYQCTKVYNLKCLAVTWDNGLLSEYAKENIKTVVDTLGVDHSYYRVSEPVLKKLYRLFFLKTGMFCPVCMRGIGAATTAMAEAFNIPLVVNGTCLRHEEYVSPKFFNTGPIGFFKEVLKDSNDKSKFRNFTYNGSLLRQLSYYFFWWSKIQRVYFYAAINLPDYIDWNYDHIVKNLQSEAKWRTSNPDKEHEDCIASPLVAYMRQIKFPALKPELLRYSKFVTSGIMSRDEAKEKIERSEKENKHELHNFKDVIDRIGISEKEFYQITSDPLRHERYIVNEHGKIFRTAQKMKKLFFN